MADRHRSSTGPASGPASGPAPATVTLASAPALGPLLVRGALRSPFRHPAPDAEFPRTRLVLPGLRVDRSRLAAYERICGFTAGAAGGRTATLPVTYPHVLGFPLAMRLMSARDFPLPLLGLVHTSVEIVRHRALPAGEVYEVAVHLAAPTAHRKGTQAVVVTELRAAGEPVWESRSTYLARHRATGTATAAGRGEPRAPLPARSEWHLPGDLGRRYGAVSGDRNPIHLHPLTARAFGFRRPIAHGMWTVARCLAALPVPAATAVRAGFRAPVALPGTVICAADDTGRFELRGAGGRPHLTGELRAPADRMPPGAAGPR